MSKTTTKLRGLWLLAAVIVTCSTATAKETPNAIQARRLFNEVYQMVYGPNGSQLRYAVNIIGIYKTEGTIWMKGKKSKFTDERYIAWNDDVTYYRYERKKKTVTIYDAHSDERDKYATKFKFQPDNYTYSIRDDQQGYIITLKAKKHVKGIKEAQVLLDKRTHHPKSVRIKVGIFHTTIRISNFSTRTLPDEMFSFPRAEYGGATFIDKRN